MSGVQRRVADALKATFISLRNRNYRLFFVGQTISNTGNWLTTVALTLLVLKITGSGFAVGLLAACQFGPILFLSAFAGALADRRDKRHMLLWTQSLEMVQSLGLAAVAFMPHPPLAALYALAIWGGCLLAFDNPLRRSFVSEMVRPEDIPNAVVLYSTIVNVARMIGPALAGVLVVTVGFGWSFAIDAASYLVVIACIVAMRPSELHRKPPKPREAGEVRAGIAYVASIPKLWIGFMMLLIVGTLSYNFNVTLPLYVTKGLGASAAAYTLLYSAFSFGAVVSALLVAHRGWVRVRHILWGAAALGLTMLVLAVVPTAPAALPVVFAVGMASIVYLTSTTAIIQIEAKPEMHGRVLALQTVVIGGTSLIGGPLLGWLADVAGGRAPIALGGVAALAAATLGYLVARRYRRQAPDEREPVPAQDLIPAER